jgi:hypothetical protein
MGNAILPIPSSVANMGAGTGNTLPPPQPTNGGNSGDAGAPSNCPSLNVSDWLAYPRSANCCCSKGGDGPIDAEIYLRGGVSVPFGGRYAQGLKPGWVIDGGLRTLFFNPVQDAAWVVETGVSNIYYLSRKDKQYTLLNFHQGNTILIPRENVTPISLNQTFLNVAFGRECYLWGSALNANTQPTCRVGCDIGGRFGSEKLSFIEIIHRTDGPYGFFFAIHTDVEFPVGCCILQFGARAEYNYIISDILQSQNNADVQSVNFLLTTGIRF